jgi:hypothetical protein
MIVTVDPIADGVPLRSLPLATRESIGNERIAYEVRSTMVARLS